VIFSAFILVEADSHDCSLNEALRGREQQDLVRQLDEHYTCMM
jgi:hypothetical protein